MGMRWWVAATLPWLVVLAGPAARAQQPQRASEGEQAGALEADDLEQVAAAIEQLGAQADRRAVIALRDRIRQGLPPQLLQKAIEALGAIRRTDAVAALAEVSTYRRPAVRAAVARALGATGVRGAVRHLTRLLDDPSPVVRAAAAEALGELDPRGAMRDLLRAARRGLPQATAVVGSRSTAGQAAALARQLETGDLDTLGPALKQLATREDLSAFARRAVVRRLAELEVLAAQRLLQQIIAELPADDRVRGEAVEALEALQAEAEEQEGAEEQASGDAEFLQQEGQQ